MCVCARVCVSVYFPGIFVYMICIHDMYISFVPAFAKMSRFSAANLPIG